MTFLLAAVLIATAPAAASDVIATHLDGSATRGALQQWDDAAVVITTPAGEKPVATDELLSLRWSTTPEKSRSESPPESVEVELIDGTTLPISDIQLARATVRLTPAAPTNAHQRKIELDRRQLAAVRLQPLEPAAAVQWEEIRDLSLASDVLVVLKRDGKSLDYVEGVLGDVAQDKIDFKLDGEPVRIDRAKVAGFIFYRRDQQERPEPKLIVQTRSGLRANVVRVQLEDGIAHLTTGAGAKLEWPLEDITLADYSAGKLVYLSDLEPASERWTPLVALPAGATLAAQYGRPRRDQSSQGSTLTLSIIDEPTTAISTSTQTFAKGLALRSRTELIYRLPIGYRRFAALAGIDPASSASGHVRLQIFADDRALLETDIAGHQPPQPIDLDIAGVKRLKIVVDYGQNLDAGDWLNLCDARIVK